ncbi:hypothetical protein R3P38DRAFT_3440198 [Favolaschia claudopus]|uniref:Uncharacterized protein n=1 Tax=Favolaschia claudopus TaxID=2862362 RepID=A0AAW0CZQ3_9AGAR
MYPLVLMTFHSCLRWLLARVLAYAYAYAGYQVALGLDRTLHRRMHPTRRLVRSPVSSGASIRRVGRYIRRWTSPLYPRRQRRSFQSGWIGRRRTYQRHRRRTRKDSTLKSISCDEGDPGLIHLCLRLQLAGTRSYDLDCIVDGKTGSSFYHPSSSSLPDQPPCHPPRKRPPLTRPADIHPHTRALLLVAASSIPTQSVVPRARRRSAERIKRVRRRQETGGSKGRSVVLVIAVGSRRIQKR